MEIIQINEQDKRDFLDLLLLADEDAGMIERYLSRGELFALYDNGLKSICVVTQESDTICELKNIATVPDYQGQGYGSRLIAHITKHYQGRYAIMQVGTGDVPRSLRFYEKNGFTLSHRVKNFFTDHYDHQMIEDGIPLVDMVYLQKRL